MDLQQKYDFLIWSPRSCFHLHFANRCINIRRILCKVLEVILVSSIIHPCCCDTKGHAFNGGLNCPNNVVVNIV